MIIRLFVIILSLIFLFGCNTILTGNPVCDNNLEISNYFGCFKITEETLKDLKNHELDTYSLTSVESLKDKEFTKTGFKDALCKFGISMENMNLILRQANYYKISVGNKWLYNMNISFSENISKNIPDELNNLVLKQVSPELSVEILEATENTYKERITVTIPSMSPQINEVSNNICEALDSSHLNEPTDWQIEKDEIVVVPAGTYGCKKFIQTDSAGNVYSMWVSKYIGSFVKKVIISPQNGTTLIELKSYEFAK